MGINTPLSSTEQVEQAQGLSLFPNPAQNQVNLVIDPNWTSNEYQLINPLGSLLRKGEIAKGTNTQQLSLIGLPNGVYFFQLVQLGKTLGTAKLVVFH